MKTKNNPQDQSQSADVIISSEQQATSLLSGALIFDEPGSNSLFDNLLKKDFFDHEITGDLWVGIDVGSTTAKIAVIEPNRKKLLYWKYNRHFSRQAETVQKLLTDVHATFPKADFKTSICGSGAEPIADIIGGCFVQEVIANSIAVSELFPTARTCVELGGQDAKILFFRIDEKTHRPKLSDMRMNGCCAGGTGAFIDQIATLIDVSVEKFDAAAKNGKNVFNISGRCGVFAKTDLQPLLNMGAAKDDIALSVFHAVAKQTITGLGHGMQLAAPVVFLGGPFSFNHELVKVFAQHLNLSREEIFIPPCPQVTIAVGAALAVGILPDAIDKQYRGKTSLYKLSDANRVFSLNATKEAPFFENQQEREAFQKRYAVVPFVPKVLSQGSSDVYIGIDSGSTTIKFVLLDKSNEIINKFYASNSGDPLNVVKKALLDIHDLYLAQGVNINVLGLGTTGYGESLVAKAFGADFHTVETIAHAHAAMQYAPDVTFVLDLGGQDMKAMRIKDGVICDLYLNEACSAGCGSFIETLSMSLKIPIQQVAECAFKAKSPSKLGSRCTVFMNSSITTEQKNGKSIEDIIAGLCRSIIDNLFMKVIRDRNESYLGNKIVVQGGTFKNDAVLRAFEQHTNATIIRPEHAGEMGAFGIALLTKEFVLAQNKKSDFIGFEELRMFDSSDVTHDTCLICSNSCKRTIIRFSNGAVFCAGNRCEKGNVESVAHHKNNVAEALAKKDQVPSLVRFRENAMLRDYTTGTPKVKRTQTIGIPRILEFYNSIPYWKTLFMSLGYTVMLSPKSNHALYQKGLHFVASDNICFPAKIAHGHIEYLVEQQVDRIFMPLMITVPSTLADKDAIHMCPIVQGYPIVLKEMNKPHMRTAVAVDSPSFRWDNEKMRDSQVCDFLCKEYGLQVNEVKQAIRDAGQALIRFRKSMQNEGACVLADLAKSNKMGVVLTGRPYHYDPYINHGVPEVFSTLGIPLLTTDSLPDLDKIDLSHTRPDIYNPFHSEVYSVALFAAAYKNLQVVQLVSFGCGHDAIISDELTRLLNETCGKQPLVLKIDEGEALGALGIRIRSFIETLRRRQA